MAQFGYKYESYSTFNVGDVRNETHGHGAKPFAPFVPKKTIVPVSSQPYSDEPYHARGEGEWRNHQQKSPVRGSPREVDNFHTKPPNEPNRSLRSIPVTSPRHSPIGGTNRNGNRDGYDATNYGYGNKEGGKPIGSTIQNDNYDGYNNGTNGYGGNREGRKPIAVTVRNEDHDGYNGYDGSNGYGGNREGRKPIAVTVRNEDHGGYNGSNGYGGNREGRKPIAVTVRNEDHDGYNGSNRYGGDYGNYGNKEGRKPIGGPEKNNFYDGYHGIPKGYGAGYEGHYPTGSPIRNNGYGDYNKKEGHNPSGSPIRNNGYGDNNKKEGHHPTGSPIRNGYNNGYGGYGDHADPGTYFNNKERPRPAGNEFGPKPNPGWTPAPRKGTQLSEPTDDINKAIALLKDEAAKRNGYGSNGGPKPYDNYEYDDNKQHRYDGPRPLTSKIDKGMDLVNETERLKKIATGGPQPRPSVANRDESWSNANSSLPSRFTPNTDGRGADTTRYGVINHKEAEKKFRGMTI